MAKKPRSIVFLTAAQQAAKEKREAQVAKARQRRREYVSAEQASVPAWAQPGYPNAAGGGLRTARTPNPPQPLKPRTTKAGIVVDPRGRTVGGLSVPTATSTRTKPQPARATRTLASTARKPTDPIQTAATTHDTVPAHAKQPTPAKPRTLAGASVTQQSRRQATKPKPKPRTTRSRPPGALVTQAPPNPYGDLPTPQQLAAAEYAPTFTGYDVEAQKDARAAAERQRAVQGFTLALMREMGGIAPGVSQDFTQAAQGIQGIAGAAADRLTAAGVTSNAGVQADLQAIGAPAEQQAQLAQQSQDVFTGGAAAQFYQEGASPAEFLLGEGARQTAYARQLPGFAALSGQQNFRQALYEAEQERQDLQGRRAATVREMGARVPYYEMQLQSEQARRQEAAVDAAIKQQAATTNAQIAAASFGLRQQGQAFDQQATTIRLGNDRTRLQLQGLQADRNWQATLRRLGISDKGLQLRAAQAQAKARVTTKNGGYTSAQRKDFAKQAGGIANAFYYGLQPGSDDTYGVGQAHGGYDETTKSFAMDPWSDAPNGYQVAMRYMITRGIPLSVAQKALNSLWTRAGKNGRPTVPFQQRGR